MNQTFGYVRVSSKDQNETRQILSMREYGVNDKNIIMDKISGKDFERPGYKILMKKLRHGDTLVIKSIDRLGRNYNEILEQWNHINKTIGANIVVLDMPLLNTETDTDLTRTLICDIVLQLLSYVAQTEREFIKQRQREGIEAAKKRGVTFGRQPKVKPPQYESYRSLWKSGKISCRKAAKALSIHHSTFMRWVKNDFKDSNE